VGNIVTATGVGKSYADGERIRPILSELSFGLDAGEVLALMGPSGSGKSTLLNLLAGILEPDAGSIILNVGDERFELGSLPAAARARVRRRSIGYVFQFFNLIPTLTVRENVLLPLELNRRPDLSGRALARLSALGMDPRADDFPEHLSGGERQRTAIARALAHEPVLVLADEPTGNLDGENARRVADMLISHARELGAALVVATHDESVAARADHVLALRQ
jgi:putative ABC transport system ATP-binding protein